MIHQAWSIARMQTLCMRSLCMISGCPLPPQSKAPWARVRGVVGGKVWSRREAKGNADGPLFIDIDVTVSYPPQQVNPAAARPRRSAEAAEREAKGLKIKPGMGSPTVMISYRD